MYKKKRSQVTVYIILGIIILFVAILFFYLRGTTEKVESMQELVRAQKIPEEVRPITNYVTTQLDDAAKKGLLLIGMQGGCIYEGQGGLTRDDTKSILYNKNNVSYGLYKQKIEYISFYQPNPPNYPWHKFPYTLDINSGYFGVYNLPPLTGSGPSIQLQLEYFIINYMQENIDLMIIFNEWGFDIDADINKINVSVIIGENDVTAFLTYPLEITKRSTSETTSISYFYTNPQIRLRKVYNLAHDLMKKDIVGILFDVDSPDNDKDNINIEKIEDAYEHDDIIIIRDNKSMLYAEPYTFQFARENRYPALHYINHVSPFLFSLPPPFPTITEGEIHSRVNPKAYDPDEDKFFFSYSPSPYQLKQSDFDNGYISLTVYVKEKDNEAYQDWQ